jgi:molybdopterin-dependent oxidoreductase alpha subunit
MAQTVGGGPKKVLYTLNQVRRIGLRNSAKALSAKNTCKACGLGMGGQQGGMTNEAGEFPSVCNKSVQAQSTDIQPPIPKEIFSHTVDDLKELSAYELEHLGRLSYPLYKTASDNNFKVVEWDWALQFAADQFKSSQAGKSFFYSSGRSSNEAGFLLQLLSRMYGTNNVTNCSFYCHQSTSIGLRSTIGSGTATVELNDLDLCDLIFVIGANPASNHPRFIHKLKNCRERGGHVVVINPAKEPGLVKFAVPKSPKSMIIGGSDIASLFFQPKIGSDIALLKGIAKSLLEIKAQNNHFIEQHCENFQVFEKDTEETSWKTIEESCGLKRENIEEVARMYANSESAIFAWGMGITHHQHGCDNVEYIANLALLRGMVGRAGAGLLPLRGHSNVQGIGSVGVKPDLGPTALRETQYRYGIKVPKEKGLDTLAAIERAAEGEIDNALIVGGNLFAASPDSNFISEALNKINFKLYLTTTLNSGHLNGTEASEVIILPVLARDEECQPTTQESMFNEVDILSSFAENLFGKAMFDADRFGNHEELREGIANTVPGMEKIKDIANTKQEFHVSKRVLHKPAFKTSSNKARFCVHDIPNAEHENYPFLLSTVRSEGQFNSIIYEETDSYRDNATRDSLFICKKDMEKLGLSRGDSVRLISSSGNLENLKVLPFDLAEGSLMAYYPEANVLAERKVDARSRTPNFKSIPVRVEPL